MKDCRDSRLEQRLGTERTENSSQTGVSLNTREVTRGEAGLDTGIGNIKIVWYLFKVWSLISV